MALFSERYGYTKPSDIIVRESITTEIQNAICNCYDKLQKSLSYNELGYTQSQYPVIAKQIWEYFQKEKIRDFCNIDVAIDYIEDQSNEWYKKLNLIEFTIKYLHRLFVDNTLIRPEAFNFFIQSLNYEFKRLNFAYRVIDMEIAEITSEEEIVAIEEALSSSNNNIRTHLNDALNLYAKKPIGDYRNSIKESISAVEAFCREKTGEDTLGKALNKLEISGVIMPEILKMAFHKLYAYTNHPDTGIRHALMDDEGSYVPQAEEALFMLVSCSAFINYLNKKAE